MRRRCMCVFCGLFLVLLVMVAPVSAAETGSVSVTLSCGELPVKNGGMITIYKVGEPVTGGYRLSKDYGGGLVAGAETGSASLPQWLAEQSGGNGITRYVDADGNVTFSPLEAGLYLVVQTDAAAGYYPIAPFLVELPYLKQWHVQAMPKMEELPQVTPETGDGILLSLWGMLSSGAALVLMPGLKKKLE